MGGDEAPADMMRFMSIPRGDRAIQAHGGKGFALEYGLPDMWCGVRLIRTASVSREMILRYVAEHSLGLPKSC
jgi:acyl-CoA dehydrogenase